MQFVELENSNPQVKSDPLEITTNEKWMFQTLTQIDLKVESMAQKKTSTSS
jgi:hypothetical protein